ncbi:MULTISPECIES: flagellar hook-length control protein FliK [Halomonadaceae]|uniref:Flagellar hook-length control protein n=1 Tax=Vreelandella titanicae TaxID=664683 RepID=A0AAP9T2Y5_9GAMM|nr:MULTISPECIES: flagellar hook-length control protein FliK [Halomonas]QKS26358.1 Flagellar hook-length control protein [Halomonas titanicae]CDG52460.1 Flagellar hook-length control protein (modular protein) [Halomonas sp. A3H3]SDI77157.1 hook-length control protein FliK [Halomonas titanicae]|tara:strand:- start:423 stop:2147 length:1725 start_codon:yes stop_codon:yes gene_type:complete
MNIHQLLSVSQSSPQPQSPGAFNRQDPVNGLFHQALLQASDTQRLSATGLSEISASQAPLQQTQLNAHGNLVSEGLEVDVENLSAALETLGLDVSESDLSELLAQLQLPNSDISADTLGLNGGQVSTPLDEIAGRLALMASFTGSSPEAQLTSSVAPATLEAISKQLNISQAEAAQLVDTPALKAITQYVSTNNSEPTQPIDPAGLMAIAEQLNISQAEAAELVDTPAFKAITQYLSTGKSGPAQPIDSAALEVIAKQLNMSQTEAAQLVDTSALKTIAQYVSTNNSEKTQPIDPAALEAIADQLNINQTEAAQLVSALNVLIGQQQSAQTLPVDSARISDARSPVVELQAAPRPQPDTFVAQINTTSASPKISSEALMGALLTLEGSTKGSPAGEHLLSGFSLSAGGPIASSQSAQAFAPTVTPTAATLATPVTSPAWSQQLSQQLVQISQRGGEQHIQMQLNPAELGPLSISLKFGEQGAQAHFLSAHAQVRQVLEQAIPQLREALAEQGISLGETSVGEQRDPNAQAFAQSGGKKGSEVGSDNGEIGSETHDNQSAGSSPLIMDGRVDLYA